MKQHLRWIVPVLCIPVVGVAGPAALTRVAEGQGRMSPGAAFAFLVGYALVLVGVVVSFALAVRGGRRTHREWRRRTGRLNPVEQQEQNAARERAQAWHWAARVRTDLRVRRVPPVVTVWDVIARPGEVFFLDVQAEYERYYGRDVRYGQSSGFYLGSPAFVLLGLAADSIGNSNRRRQAEYAAAVQWRERQWSRVLVSNQRVAVHAGGRWLDFDHTAVRAVYPEMSNWALVCDFGEAAEPLRLRGTAVPGIAVLVLFALHGHDVLDGHPALHALDSSTV